MSPKKKFKSATVSIIGRPNAGKSTLLNALLESPFSATSKRPQTTRRNIRGILQLFDSKKNWNGQLVIIDTPGLNFKKGLLDRAMYMAVEETLIDVDVALWVADARGWAKDLKDIEREAPGSDRIAGWLKNQIQKKQNTKWVLALSKVDLVEKGDLLPLIQKTAELIPEFSEIVPIAAELGIRNKASNLTSLLNVIEQSAPEGSPLYDQESWTDLDERDLIQNLIREAIFRQGREEVPYECDATIDSFRDPSGKEKMPEVHATIWVSKASLKPILVGKAGSRIKELNHSVRTRYEEVTGEQIVLKLFVKVVEKWNQQLAELKNLGYVVD